MHTFVRTNVRFNGYTYSYSLICNRGSKYKSKETKQLKSNSLNMESTNNEAQGNDVLDSSNTTTFKPAGKLGDGESYSLNCDTTNNLCDIFTHI